MRRTSLAENGGRANAYLGRPFRNRLLLTMLADGPDQKQTVNSAPHIRSYVTAALLFLALNAAWEVLQLPLYTLWHEGSASEIAFALAHCTVGDLMIGLVSAAAAAFTVRAIRLPGRTRRAGFLLAFLVMGLSYTVFSEWLNVHVRQSWTYTELMPLLPPLGTGLTPFLQWIVVPLATWWIVLRPRSPTSRGLPPRPTIPSPLPPAR
jgi:hypothetical protein